MTRIAAPLAKRLVASQFPRWADLTVRPVERDGHDNVTFRLGDELTLRFPSGAAYAAKVEKEHAWLPRLASGLPVAIPESLALGRPSAEFPWPWSVRRWIDGETADVARVDSPVAFATSLGEFLAALRRIDPSGGPPPGAHNFHRGAPPAVYDDATRAAIASLGGRMDADAATAAWDAALAATFRGAPVWLHGDVAPGNLLVRDGRLVAAIDFGGTAVGDPACDLAIAWTFFADESRAAFRAAVGADDDEWARGRGWALWKALITWDDAASRRVADEALADFSRSR